MTKMHDSRGIRELYPRERNACISIKHELLQKYSFRNCASESQENDLKRQFSEECVNRLFEIGLMAKVRWEPEVYEYNDGSHQLVWEPEIEIYDRLGGGDVVDFDRMKHEVRAGDADGIKGVLDPNTGEIKEEPKSKPIY